MFVVWSDAACELLRHFANGDWSKLYVSLVKLDLCKISFAFTHCFTVLLFCFEVGFYTNDMLHWLKAIL